MNPWHWHPSVVIGLWALLALYLAGVGPLRRRYRWGSRPPARQVAAFLGGIGVMAIALLGPLADLAEHVALSAHMLQHLLFTFVVAPLWLLGIPAWLLRPLLRVPGVARVGWLLTRPVPALVIGSAPLMVWHVPALYQAALEREPIHIVEHLTMIGGALLAWWPVLGPLPEWPRPAAPLQLLYLFLCTIPMTVAAAPITLADGLLYPFYAQGRAARWPLAPPVDQEVAGILMWLGGTLGYLIAGTVVFFRWAAREGGDEAAGTGGAPLPEPR